MRKTVGSVFTFLHRRICWDSSWLWYLLPFDCLSWKIGKCRDSNRSWTQWRHQWMLQRLHRMFWCTWREYQWNILVGCPLFDKIYQESQESNMMPLLMNSISMKGVLVIMNTVTTVSARLVVFSLALDMYLLSAFLGRLTLIEVRVLVVYNRNMGCSKCLSSIFG